MRAIVLLLAAAAVMPGAEPVLAVPVTLDVGALGRVTLTVPAGWTATVEPAQAPALPSLRVMAPDERASLDATVIADEEGAQPFDTPERVDAVVRHLSAALRASPGDPELPRHRIAGARCFGAWAGSVRQTPAGPPAAGTAPAGHPATTTGVVKCGRVALVFTLKTAALDGDDHAAALQALASTRND